MSVTAAFGRATYGVLAVFAPIIFIASICATCTTLYKIEGHPMLLQENNHETIICKERMHFQIFNGLCSTDNIGMKNSCVSWSDSAHWQDMDEKTFLESNGTFSSDTQSEAKTWGAVRIFCVLSNVLSLLNAILVFFSCDHDIMDWLGMDGDFWPIVVALILLSTTTTSFLIIIVFTNKSYETNILNPLVWHYQQRFGDHLPCNYRSYATYPFIFMTLSTIFCCFSIFTAVLYLVVMFGMKSDEMEKIAHNLGARRRSVLPGFVRDDVSRPSTKVANDGTDNVNQSRGPDTTTGTLSSVSPDLARSAPGLAHTTAGRRKAVLS